MNPLEQLQDIALPEPVSAFPWAWGWWLLLIAAISVLVALGWWLRQRRRHNRFRVAALQQLQQLDVNHADYGAKVQQLLKQTLMAYQPREQIASLNGDQWHQQLNHYHPVQWQQLLGNPYQPDSPHGGEALRQAAQSAIARIAKEGHHA